MIAWNEHPAYVSTRVAAHPDAELEREAAALFAPEAKRVYPARGWRLWKERYPDICANVAVDVQDKGKLRDHQRRVARDQQARATGAES